MPFKPSIHPDNIEIFKEIGKGEYGTVFSGMYHAPLESGETIDIPVALKQIGDLSDPKAKVR